MKVEYIYHMGCDLRAANVARVSFAKWKEVFNERDESLINYLVSNEHWTPLAHNMLSIRVKAPIFVARQLAKHQVGLVWNEESRRYINSGPEFFFPENWRQRPENKKQGSGENFDAEISKFFTNVLIEHCRESYLNYTTLISQGVAPEQARMFLPINAYTEWVWTGSLWAFFRVVALRTKPDAQEETQFIAKEIANIIVQRWPICYKAFTETLKKVE